MRITGRWRRNRTRSLPEQASAAAGICWKAGCDGLLELENAGFESHSLEQRLNIIEELTAFLLVITHGMARQEHTHIEADRFLQETGRHLARLSAENRQDAGEGAEPARYAERINARLGEYGNLPIGTPESPDHALLRATGRHVADAVATDPLWVIQQVVEYVAPDCAARTRAALSDLLVQRAQDE